MQKKFQCCVIKIERDSLRQPILIYPIILQELPMEKDSVIAN